MNLDAFTNPPPNTYMLHTQFTLVDGSNIISAVAITRNSFPILVAIYTIIVQLLFVAIWRLLAHVLLYFHPLTDPINVLGAVSFWNSHDPYNAVFSSLGFLNLLGRHGKKLGATAKSHWLPATAVFLAAFLTAVGGLVAGILYPDSLRAGQVAPVAPSAVFWPTQVIDVRTYGRPGIMRAMGSAETGTSVHSQSTLTNFRQVDVPGSNFSHPQARVDYSYDVTAQDLGLQRFPDLELRFNGSCQTTYAWLRKGANIDSYLPWDDESQGEGYPVPNENTTKVLGGRAAGLEFEAFLHPDIKSDPQRRNRTFAFAAITSQVTSFTSNSDPWYYAQPVEDGEAPGLAPYIVRSGRPMLECWETAGVCLRSKDLCWDTQFTAAGDGSQEAPLPDGIKYLITSRFGYPMAARIALSMQAATLKSYVGSIEGMIIDAQSASLYDEMQRLILASYLASAQVFRELVFSDKPSGKSNDMEESSGVLRDGVADFTVGSPDVVAVRITTLIVAPALTLVFWFLNLFVKLYLRVSRDTNKLAIRAAALSAPQLFRMLHENVAAAGSSQAGWAKKMGWLPAPTKVTTDGVTIEVKGHNDGAYIEFNSGRGILSEVRQV